VPFAREYGGLLDNRSFGGAQVSRTFYARGQTGQQLLLGAYQALERRSARHVKMFTAHRDARPHRRRRPRARHRHARPRHRRDRGAPADAVVLATGGYGNVFYLSTNAKGCNVTATWRAHKRGRLLRQPLLHADPPDLHPGQPATTSRSSR
jgi:succinate dehydrogenase / fumarate reductase flavoprotein subunit